MVSGSAGRLSAAVSGGAFVAGIVPWGYSINRVTSSASFRPRCALIRHENIFVRSNCIVLIGGRAIRTRCLAAQPGPQRPHAFPAQQQTSPPPHHPPPPAAHHTHPHLHPPHTPLV